MTFKDFLKKHDFTPMDLVNPELMDIIVNSYGAECKNEGMVAILDIVEEKQTEVEAVLDIVEGKQNDLKEIEDTEIFDDDADSAMYNHYVS